MPFTDLSRPYLHKLIAVIAVIAVIAILVSVLVPAFTSLFSSAKLSNDSVTVKYINDALSADETIDGNPLNIIDAFEVLYKSGFTAEIPAWANVPADF